MNQERDCGKFRGEGKNILFQKCKYKNIRCVWDSFSLLGSFYFTHKRVGSRINGG